MMNPEKLKAGILAQLGAYAERQLDGAAFEQVVPFLDEYYSQVDSEDLQDRSIADLFGAAMSHYRLAQQRSAGQATVRVYNPKTDEHDWQSSHTIVEIVNDDMPFLVDSVAMEVNRHGLKLHIII